MKILTSVILSLFAFGAFSFLNAQSVFASSYTNSKNLPLTYKEIGRPQGLSVLANGDIWYVDDLNFHLIKINQAGDILRVVGRQGSGEGEFSSNPESLTIDDEGNIYVLEYNGCRVDVFDFNGGLLRTWGQCGDVEDYQMSNPMDIHYDAFSDNILVSDTIHHRILRFTKAGEYISKFGTQGSGDGQFDGTADVSTDAAGNIYVADGGANQRIQVFNPDGSFKFKFSDPGFNAVADAVVQSDGDIIVSSQNSYVVYRFDSEGNKLDDWGGGGGIDGQFISPHYLALDADDNIYVSDWGQNSIQKFDENGNFIWAFRNSGKDNGEFFAPDAVAYDSSGNMYVLDDGAYHGRVQKFTNAGTYLSTIIQPDTEFGLATYHMKISADDRIYTSSQHFVGVFDLSGTLLFSFGSEGAGDGQFSEARGIAFDSVGNVYVADLDHGRVEKFDADGNYLDQFGTVGLTDGQFTNPHGLLIDAADNIYVADDTRVQKFDINFNHLKTIWSEGVDSQNFSIAGTMAKDAGGNLFITEFHGARVQVFDSSDNYVESFGTFGSGVDQFYEPGDVVVNPVTDTIVVVDGFNGRLEFFDFGVRIQGLNPSADVIDPAEDKSLSKDYWNPETPGIDNIDSTMYFGDYLISDFSVDLSSDRLWTTVNAITLPDSSKSLLVNLNPTDAPGISADHSLYIVKQAGQIGVYVCPEAALLSDLTTSCTDGYILREGDTGLSTVNVGGVDYWKIANLTGTGGLGLKAEDLAISVSSTNVAVGETLSATVTAHDQNGSNYLFYENTVHFTSTSGTAILPSNFVFSDPDLGTHTFTDQFAFTEPGDFTITVHDLDDGSLVATSQTIHVTGVAFTPTPSPTITNTPTLTPSVTPTSGGPTNTPGPTATTGPTNTVGPTNTPVPPTATPVEQSCVTNQLQLKCQADVVISNVVVTTINETSEEVCWDTNIETKGIVRYGLADTGVNDLTTAFEDEYGITNHCFTLQDLVKNSKYNFQIEADSPAGKTILYNSSFVLGVVSLPTTGGSEVPSCITLSEAVSFNSSGQAVVNYKTLSAANCTVSYGNSTNKTAFQSSVSNGLEHASTLGLENLDGKTDAYYQINCNVAATATDQAKTCTYNDVIIASQYIPYIKAQSTSALAITGLVDSYFGTPVKTAQTLNTTAVVGTAATAAIATLAYPQWLSYGFLWLRGKKKQKPWGLVYNASNMVPVAFATVRATSNTGVDVKQAVTDTTGRFGFVLDPGSYKITVDASGFDHYEKAVEVVAEQAINLDIALSGEGKMDLFTALQQGLRRNLGKISVVLTILGYLFTITSVILAPNLINITILVAYFVQSAILVFSLRTPGNGYIYNTKTMERIKGAFVRLYDVEEQRQLDVQMADSKGRYSFIADKKEYYIRVDAPGYKFPGSDNASEQIKLANGTVFIKAINDDGIHNQIGLDPA